LEPATWGLTPIFHAIMVSEELILIQKYSKKVKETGKVAIIMAVRHF
jgi:hypothetical protein